MPSISVTDVAFTGFRIVRERPRAVALWAILQLALSLALGVLVVGMAGPQMARIEALGVSAPADPTAVMSLLASIAPLYTILFVLTVAVESVVLAAMSRAVLRPTEDAFGYFRLGRDELNLVGVVLVIIALALCVDLAAAAVAGVLASVAAVFARPVEGGVLALSIIGAAVGLTVLAVRLSLAPAQTVATGRIDLAAAWRLTRGRFWPILGAYGLAGALGLVVLTLGMVMTAALVAVVGGMPAVAQISRPDYSSLATFYAPARLAQTAVSAVLNALVMPVLLTPPAAIYLRLTAAAPSFGA